MGLWLCIPSLSKGTHASFPAKRRCITSANVGTQVQWYSITRWYHHQPSGRTERETRRSNYDVLGKVINVEQTRGLFCFFSNISTYHSSHLTPNRWEFLRLYQRMDIARKMRQKMIHHIMLVLLCRSRIENGGACRWCSLTP